MENPSIDPTLVSRYIIRKQIKVFLDGLTKGLIDTEKRKDDRYIVTYPRDQRSIGMYEEVFVLYLFPSVCFIYLQTEFLIKIPLTETLVAIQFFPLRRPVGLRVDPWRRVGVGNRKRLFDNHTGIPLLGGHKNYHSSKLHVRVWEVKSEHVDNFFVDLYRKFKETWMSNDR